MPRRSKAEIDKELAEYFEEGELEQMLGEAIEKILSERGAGEAGREKTRRKSA